MLAADLLLLSAGLGKRLRPLTVTVPKPLLKVGGKTLIERNLELVSRSGARRVFINLHYLGEQIRHFVADGSRWGLEVIYAEEPVLLDTGGAIKNIEPWLKHQQLITLNSDIILGPDFDLAGVLRAHLENPLRPLITTVLRHDAEAARYGEFGVDDAGRIVFFLGTAYGAAPAKRGLMFSGVQVLEREVLGAMPERGQVFSVTQQTMKKILENQGVICSYIYSGYWTDVGTPERLERASKEVVKTFGIP